MAGRLARSMHRVHRSFGAACALLLAVWFASGAVMVFVDYPSFDERERLASAPTLPTRHTRQTMETVTLPPELLQKLAEGALARGARARLAWRGQRLTWLLDDGDISAVYGAQAPWTVEPLAAAGARAEARQRVAAPITSSELLEEPDQWTVGLPARLFPLWRLRADDAAAHELYVARDTGEVVQQTTARERLLAWLGPIPHWVYPTLLRRERALWRFTVLALAGLGLTVSLSGLLAGTHVYRVARHKPPLRNRLLRWHHRLGLAFGLLVSSWLFSGALSLSPFQWAGERGPSERERAQLFSPPAKLRAKLPRPRVAEALALCQTELSVRELELLSFAGGLYALCHDQRAATRLVDLTAPTLALTTHVSPMSFTPLAQQLAAGQRYGLELAHAFDDYYYPTHRAPHKPLPFVRISIADDAGSTLYIDPARARLLARHTDKTRLERWLYHGLHSFDWPLLYRQAWLWRGSMVLAMSVGFALSALGLALALRRSSRARLARRR